MKKISWYIKLFVFSLVVSVIPLMISGLNILDIADEELKSNLNNELLNNVNGVSEKIDNYFEDWIRNLIIISDGIEDPNLGDNERYSFLYNGIGNIPDVINCTVFIQRQNGSWEPAVELNREQFAAKLEEVNLKTQDIIKYNTSNFNLARTGSFVQGTEYIGLIESWASNIVIPFKTDGGLEGVLACKVDLENVRRSLDETTDRLQNEINIISKDSLLVFGDNKKKDFNRTEQDVLGLLKTGNRVNSIINYKKNDENIVGSYTFTRYPGWGILTEATADFAYLPARRILYSIILWIIIGLVLAIIGVVIIARQISTPVAKMSDVSRRIASGDFDIKIDYQAKDSLGVLAGNIEGMASDLKKSFSKIEKQNKELEEYNRTLEIKVKERTEKLDNSNRELKSAYLRLVELNREKDEFLGIAAHDLKNPLAAIRGYSELLCDENDPEEIKQFGEVIYESSERMLEIINLLLTVNKIEQGNYTVSNSEFDAVKVIKQLVLENKRIAQKKSIELLYNGPDNLTIIYDSLMLSQILDNLISNAIKFSLENKNIFIDIKNEEDHITLKVKDEGQGIPEEDKSRVFEKFSKLSVKPTAGENTTGLGLSIVKGLVELSGGSITFNSKVGEGTEFIVKLPVVYDNKIS